MGKLKPTLFLFFLLFLLSCQNNENSITTIEKTLIIASKKVDCQGVALQKCLLVKKDNQQNWEYFYSPIIGFAYESGFEYEIIVLEKEIENPPQDASSIEYSLVEIISKTKKTSENLPN